MVKADRVSYNGGAEKPPYLLTGAKKSWRDATSVDEATARNSDGRAAEKGPSTAQGR